MCSAGLVCSRQCSDHAYKKSKRTLITLFLTITHGILVTLSVSLLRKPRLYSFASLRARVYQFYLDLNHSVSLSKRLLLYYLPAKIAIFCAGFCVFIVSFNNYANTIALYQVLIFYRRYILRVDLYLFINI